MGNQDKGQTILKWASVGRHEKAFQSVINSTLIPKAKSLLLEGAWRDPFGSPLDMAIEQGVRTQRRFRRIAETIEEKEEPHTTTGCGSKTFLCVADIVKEIMGTNQSGGDHQQAAKTEAKAWKKYIRIEGVVRDAPPGMAIDELILHLHLGGVSCRSGLTNYSHWDSPSLPAHGATIRIWCSASMGGLHPNEFEPDQAAWLIELHNALGLQFSPAVLTSNHRFSKLAQQRSRIRQFFLQGTQPQENQFVIAAGVLLSACGEHPQHF